MRIIEIGKGDKLTIIINKSALRNPRARKVIGDVAGIDTITVDISDIDNKKSNPRYWYFSFVNKEGLKVEGLNGWSLVNGLYGEHQLLKMSRLPKPIATFLINGERVEA